MKDAKEMLGENYDSLNDAMLFISTSTGVILPSPLFPVTPLSPAEQKNHKQLKSLRTAIVHLAGDYSDPIEYIPAEERINIFSALSIFAINQFNIFRLSANIENEEFETRKRKTMAKFREMFEKHIPEIKLKSLEDIFNKVLVRN
jgi:hypothetical protein